jgi:hypothetical protein
MSEWVQQFFASSVSTNTVVLSPDARGTTCLRTISLPPQLSAQQITVVTTSATAPNEFWSATGTCQKYRVHIQRVN